MHKAVDCSLIRVGLDSNPRPFISEPPSESPKTTKLAPNSLDPFRTTRASSATTSRPTTRSSSSCGTTSAGWSSSWEKWSNRQRRSSTRHKRRYLHFPRKTVIFVLSRKIFFYECNEIALKKPDCKAASILEPPLTFDKKRGWESNPRSLSADGIFGSISPIQEQTVVGTILKSVCALMICPLVFIGWWTLSSVTRDCSYNILRKIIYIKLLVNHRGMVAQSKEHSSKGPWSVQLCWREFESRPWHKVVGKNLSWAIFGTWK